ncbi:MAG: carbohydrate kinase [Bacteroidales bacterium]|nr:MAG: carbohydrate kinase [Bacteroidales bacterium]
MKKKFKIAGIGEVLWDVFDEHRMFGGAPANCACHCSSLGADAYVISCMGNDKAGHKGLDFLAKHGVDTSGIAISEEFETGIVNVKLDAEGKPEYEIRENVAWDHIPFTKEMEAIAPELNAVCFGTLSQRNIVSKKTLDKFLYATSPECLRMFDINIRQNYYSNDVILSSLKHANALKINDEELPILAELMGISGSEEDQLKAILESCRLKLAILTCGAKGALMITEDELSFETPPKPEIIASTVGAGDSFTAAAIIGYLQNKNLSEINKHANAVASYVCTQTGAVPVLPESLIKTN